MVRYFGPLGICVWPNCILLTTVPTWEPVLCLLPDGALCVHSSPRKSSSEDSVLFLDACANLKACGVVDWSPRAAAGISVYLILVTPANDLETTCHEASGRFSEISLGICSRNLAKTWQRLFVHIVLRPRQTTGNPSP